MVQRNMEEECCSRQLRALTKGVILDSGMVMCAIMKFDASRKHTCYTAAIQVQVHSLMPMINMLITKERLNTWVCNMDT